MVAGDAQAKTKAQLPAESKAEWFCEGGGGGALDANGFPSATCGTHLQQLLYFPSCVNEATSRRPTSPALMAPRTGAPRA
ncbi:hypothetical protein VDGD_21359 [Verticillium dahliae]|nr:hypothetical protein VDGD_21359 [Verticillium dahliae]